MQVVTSVESEVCWGWRERGGRLWVVGVCAAGPGGMKMQMQMQDARRLTEQRMEMSRQVKKGLHMRWRGARRGGDRGRASKTRYHGRPFQE